MNNTAEQILKKNLKRYYDDEQEFEDHLGNVKEDILYSMAEYANIYRRGNLRVDKEIAEDYLTGLMDYLDMILDAEVFEKNRVVYQQHQDNIKETVRILSLYKLKK